MPSIHSAFPSTYIRALDLGSKRVPVTISHLKMEDVGGDGERKPVLYFQGKDKGVVLNKTNANSVIEIAGTDDYSKWTGTVIVLFESTTDYKGKTVNCIRISAPKPDDPKPSEGDEDPIPF